MDFGKLSLYLEEIMSYKNVKIISHREIHSEYIDVYFHISDFKYVYSEFIDLDDYSQWFIKRERLNNIDKIIEN